MARIPPQLMQAANVPTDDVSTAGGAMSATQIVNAAPGEWCPRLKAPATGVIDTDAVSQVQLAYIWSPLTGTGNIDNAGYYVDNLLIIPSVAGAYSVTPSNAGDDASKKKRAWGVLSVGGTLDFDDVTLGGAGVQTSGTKSFSRILRTEVLLTADDSPSTLVGRAVEQCGTQVIGATPAGESISTSEREYSTTTTLGDAATYANRLTPPAGLVWSRPNTAATRVYVKRDSTQAMAPGDRQALYCRETVQPGMEGLVLPNDGTIAYEEI